MNINEEVEDSKVLKRESDLEIFKKRIEAEAKVFIKNAEKFIELENELDKRKIDDFNESNTRRRKINTNRSFDFLTATYRESMEDLNEIYGSEDNLESKNSKNYKKFKKADLVTAIYGKKKYKGSIIQVGHRGLVVKTKDRRKLRISWEEIDGQEVQVFKN